ncbi:hypothetical protein Pelo_4066 [Pelomyxa schiedti]|nr:hypothetical protein Pelo_4066 [Pelomyxa schiedti]
MRIVVFYAPLFLTFIFLVGLYTWLIIKRRSEIRSWYRLGAASVKELSKADERRRLIFATLAPFPIVFLVTWMPMLVYRIILVCEAEAPVFGFIAGTLTRLWGLSSSLVYSHAHWRLILHGLTGLMSRIGARQTANRWSATIHVSDLQLLYDDTTPPTSSTSPLPLTDFGSRIEPLYSEEDD